MGVRLTGFRGVHEGTNRQESSLPVRSEAHEGNGSGAGPSRLWGGSARNPIPVDSCRFLSTRLRGGPARRGRA